MPLPVAARRLAFLLCLAALCLAAFAAPAGAQPAPDAVVGAWLRGWRASARAATRISLDEALVRRVEGPRRTVTLETRGTVSFGRDGGRPERALRSATLDGEPVAPDRVAELDRRLARAFGSEDTARPPLLPVVLFGRADAVGLALDAVDGRPAWRVSMRLRAHEGRRPARRPGAPDRAEAWFSRSADAPRLLRLRVEGGRPGATFVRTVAFERTDGLDLPSASTTTVEARQRRRLRVYATTVEAEARYSRPVVGR